MDKFSYRLKDDYIGMCDSCGMEAPLIDCQERQLCELCYSSFIGTATQYQDRKEYEQVHLFVSIAQIGNVILDKLTDRRDELPKTTTEDECEGLRAGDIVKCKDGCGVLRSGCCQYKKAIVVSIDPFVLVSWEGDMRWEETVNPKSFVRIARAGNGMLERAMTRLEK